MAVTAGPHSGNANLPGATNFWERPLKSVQKPLGFFRPSLCRFPSSRRRQVGNPDGPARADLTAAACRRGRHVRGAHEEKEKDRDQDAGARRRSTTKPTKVLGKVITVVYSGDANFEASTLAAPLSCRRKGCFNHSSLLCAVRIVMQGWASPTAPGRGGVGG